MKSKIDFMLNALNGDRSMPAMRQRNWATETAVRVEECFSGQTYLREERVRGASLRMTVPVFLSAGN